MKRPQPDINKAIVDTFIAKTGANRKLKKLWGTTNVNGVEVLNSRRHYHKETDRPDNYERLFKFLKVYDDVDEYEGEGIKSAWFTLNKSNGPESTIVPASYISDNLNSMWWDSNDGAIPDNLTLTTTITISENFYGGESITGVDWSASKEVLKTYVEDNYEALWADKKIVQEGVGVIDRGSHYDEELKVTVQDKDDLSPDDPWMAILSRYALRDDGVVCTIKDVEVGLGVNQGRIYNNIVVTLEIPYQLITTASPVVQRILDDLDTETFPVVKANPRLGIATGFTLNNEHVTQNLAKQVNFYETEDDLDADTISRVYVQWEDSVVQDGEYDDYWVKDGNTWYLKADVINNPKLYGTNHTELNTYIFGLLDTGYKKEKVSIWKKIVAAVIFIVAVVVTFVYPPSSVATSPILSAAFAVMIGSLVVSLVTFAASALDATEWVNAFAWVSKGIEPLVTVASIVMAVNMLTNLAAKAIETGATDFVLSLVDDLFLTGIKDIVSGTISTQAISVVNKTVDIYTGVQVKKLESIDSRNKDLKAEYESLAEETAMVSDIMKGFMNIYTKPATADWSVYAEKFDLPYERGGGNLAIGNIQITTKQAIRKADYEEPMFDGIKFV